MRGLCDSVGAKMVKPATCAGCVLERKGYGFLRAAIPNWSAVDLTVLGDAPSTNDLDDGKLMRSLSSILAQVSIDRKRVHCETILHCIPPVNKQGKHYPVGADRGAAEDKCSQYGTLALCPRHIPLLCVGAEALWKGMGKDSIADYHGHINLVGGRVVGATYHPSAVWKNLNLFPVVVREIQNLVDAAKDPAALLWRPEVRKGHIKIEKGAPCVFDLEWDTTSREVTCVGVAQSSQQAYSTFTVDGALEAIKEHDGPLVGHSIITADFDTMNWWPKSMKPDKVFDTKIAAHLIHAHLAELGLLSLGALSRIYHPTPDWKQDKEDLLAYNGRDCAYNYKLYEDLCDDLTMTDQWHLMEKQQRLAHMTALMRRKGIKVDVAGIAKYRATWSANREALASTFPFNPNSSQQVVKWAKEQGITLPDTKYDTIERAQEKHKVLGRLLEYKDEGKSLDVWYGEKVVDKEGFIHPAFKVTGTAVARFSCAEPNCQNVPPHLRHLIVPRDGESELVSFDFSQIENRCIAFLAADRTMVADFASGLDFHRLSASRIYNKPMEEVTSEERMQGKITVHATNYLETANHLAVRLYGNKKAESVAGAKQLQAAYFGAYPAIKQWHEKVSRGLDSGDISLRNPFGRYRLIYALNSHERAKRGTHFLGCSTGADVVNQRVLDVWRELRLLPILIVHDEAVYELPRGELVRRAQIKAILERPVQELGGMVIPTKCKVGATYGEMREVTA